LLRGGHKSEISNTAGAYICNYLMYSTLHSLAESKSDTIAGFIHVPPFGLISEEELENAGRIILDVVARHLN